MRFIPTGLHGILDYLFAAVLIILPPIFGWNEGLTLLGALVALYAFTTSFELGALKIFPMPVNLALDAVVGLLLLLFAIVPSVGGGQSMGVSAFLVIMGLIDLALALFSKWNTPGAREGQLRGTHRSILD